MHPFLAIDRHRQILNAVGRVRLDELMRRMRHDRLGATPYRRIITVVEINDADNSQLPAF